MPIKRFPAEFCFAGWVQNGVSYTFIIIGKYVKIFIFYLMPGRGTPGQPSINKDPPLTALF
jgi:hypothetical protein